MTEAELKAKISLDSSSWQAGMTQVSSGLKKISGEFGAIKNQIASAFTVHALADQTRKVIEYGSKIHDLSARFGISTDALQEFDYAAKQTGTSLDSFVVAMRRLTVSQVGAVKDNDELRAQFEALGVSMSDLASKNPEQLFRQIAERIHAGGLSSEQFAAVIKIMGRSADEILPAMLQGFSDLATEAHNVGAVLQSDVIDKLDEAGDAMVRAGEKMKPVWANIAVGAADAVSWLQKMVQMTGLGAQAFYAKLTGDWDLYEGTVEQIREITAPKKEGVKAIQKSMLPIDMEQIKTKSERAASERQLPADAQINQLQKIGAYVGGPDRLLSVAERQLVTLRKIEENTAKQSGSGITFPQ